MRLVPCSEVDAVSRSSSSSHDFQQAVGAVTPGLRSAKPYEDRLRDDPTWALREASMHFDYDLRGSPA